MHIRRRPEQTRREYGITQANALRERLLEQKLLQDLHPLVQWVNWRREPIHGKVKKVPYNPGRGYRAGPDNPRTWGTLLQALKRLEPGEMDGIGFMFSSVDPYGFLDLDHSYDRHTGKITSPLAQWIVSELQTYTEVSPNDGLHLVFRLERPLPHGLHTAIELYDRGRFMTVTGEVLAPDYTVIQPRQATIDRLYQEFKPAPLQRAYQARSSQPGKLPESQPLRTDEQVLVLATQARNREVFLELWEGRWHSNPRYFTSGKPDQSKADFHLAGLLWYWSQDRAQVDRLFRQSGLMRDKWDDNVNTGGGGHTYGEVTLFHACK